MAKEKTLGRRMADRLKQFAEELEQAGDIPARFTCRTVRLNLEPAEYNAQLVKKTRGLLNASQAIFAQFIGVSVKAVQEWEQGVKTPRGGACRLMDEIRQDPEYWRTRILDCAEPKEAV